MKNLTLIALTLCFGLSAAALADDDDEMYQHYKPEKSENLQQAIKNLNKYNATLNELISGDLDAQDQAKIHELTYTLEVALERLDDELDKAAEQLEEVHLGSESMDKERITENGKKYLKTLQKILGRTSAD